MDYQFYAMLLTLFAQLFAAIKFNYSVMIVGNVIMAIKIYSYEDFQEIGTSMNKIFIANFFKFV